MFVLLLIALNIYFSNVPELAFYFWIKFAFSSLVFIYTFSNFKNISELVNPLLAGLFVTFIVSIIQFLNNGSIGGVFYYLGERGFRITTPGISTFNFLGKEFLRPYATFPHPNALAGFSLLSVLITLFFSKSILVKYLSFVFGGVVVLLTMSHGVYLAIFMLTLIMILKFRKTHVGFILYVIFILSLAIPIFADHLLSGYFFNIDNERRLVLLKFSGLFFSERPLIGIGLGSFITRLPEVNYYWLQPVHNIFSLIFVETGIIGIFFVFLLLNKLTSRLDFKHLLLVFIVFVTGFFDHYWLTLYQTNTFLVVILALLFGSGEREVNS